MDFSFIFILSALIQIVMTKSNKGQVETIISYGMRAIDAQFPYQGFLSYDGELCCGGSIIHQRWALTAAHCIHKNYYNPQFIVGTIYTNGNSGISYGIEVFIQHPNYLKDFGSECILIYDVGLIRLAYDIQFDYKIQPIPLDGNTEAYYDYAMASFAGCGLTNQNEQIVNISVLLYTCLSIMPITECEVEFPDFYLVDEIHLCSYNVDHQQGCTSDSGSPLVLNGQQIGIASVFEEDCNGKGSTLFTKVSTFRFWIQKNLATYNDHI